MLETLLKKFDKYKRTISITFEGNKDHTVSFIRDFKYLPLLRYIYDDMWIITHSDFKAIAEGFLPSDSKVKFHYTTWPEYEFTIFHNKVCKPYKNPKFEKGLYCKIHPTAIINVDGLKVVNAPNGERIQFIHTGNVVMGDHVEIGPYCVIHRGTMGLTVIDDGCKIGAKNNIGHNCHIGKNNIFAVGSILNGGVYTGENCWFGSGSIVKHYTVITDNTVIGMGAVVTKNIIESGIYVGNPAKYLKPVKEGWNF